LTSAFDPACYDTSQVACPYFYPIREPMPPLEPMPLPLGDAWRGLCQAAAGQPFEPEPAMLVPFCHLGYARGRCAHFPPSEGGPDAVRFTVDRESSAEISVYYVLERDHHPFTHGQLLYSLTRGGFPEGRRDTLLHQAEAYVESYLRRRNEAFPASKASSKEK
jgi:hypothetical protein